MIPEALNYLLGWPYHKKKEDEKGEKGEKEEQEQQEGSEDNGKSDSA